MEGGVERWREKDGEREERGRGRGKEKKEEGKRRRKREKEEKGREGEEGLPSSAAKPLKCPLPSRLRRRGCTDALSVLTRTYTLCQAVSILSHSGLHSCLLSLSLSSLISPAFALSSPFTFSPTHHLRTSTSGGDPELGSTLLNHTMGSFNSMTHPNFSHPC